MANDLVPSGDDDGKLVVSVDSRKAEAGLKVLETRIYAFATGTQNAFNRVTSSASKLGATLTSMQKMLTMIGSFVAIRQVVQMVEGFLNRMIEVNRVFTGFIASMSIIRGSVENAAKEYRFLLDMSNRLGVSVESSISQYHRLAAALKNVDTSGELTRHIFSGISQAAVVLHSRGRDVTLIFEAVQQMASKGKLSLEELQRQLGNTLPGAMGIAARAMMKSEDFIKAGVKNAADAEQMLRQGIQKGTINVYEFLARLSNQLKKEYGEGVKYASDQFTANFNRMKNSVFEFYRIVGSSGAMEGLTSIIREITALFNDNQGQGAFGLGQALGSVFKDIATWISKLDSADIAEFFEAIRVAVTSTATVVGEFLSVFKGIGGPEVETPLLNFVEFCARTLAALVDVFKVAVAGIETVVRGIADLFYSAREAALGGTDNLMMIGSMIPGVKGSDTFQSYAKMRAGQTEARDSNADALGSAAHAFFVGPGKENTAYATVGRQFADARMRIAGAKYGVDGTYNFGYQPPGTAAIDEQTGLPSFMTPGGRKAGSSADAAAAYVNPMGDADLQRMVEDLRNNSNAPNGPGSKGKKGKKDPVQSNFLREQTRLLKDIAVAENEYQNILSNRNRSEGEAVAQMRSLLTTDERYVALSDEKKAKLMAWATQLDEANRKVQDALKSQSAMNDALQMELDVRGRVADLMATGYESKYNEETATRNSFGAGGENEFMAEENRRQLIAAAIKKDNSQRIIDAARYRAEIELTNDEMRFQADLFGKSKFEQQQAIEFRKIDLMIAQMSVGATAQQVEEYKKLADVLKTDVADALSYVQSKQGDLWAGVQRGFKDYVDSISDHSADMAAITNKAFMGMEDAFVSFVETGKLSFKDLTQSIAKDLVKLIVRYLLVWFLQKMTGLGGGGGGASPGMINMDATASQGFSGPPSYNGNVFSNGRMMKYYAKGGVFDQPTVFPMQGGFGTAFEKGPEAIMPLARDKSGKLGVSVADSGAASGGDAVVNLTVEVYQGEGTGVKTSKGKNEQGDVLKIFIGEVAADIQRGGPVAKAITTTYGVSRKAKSYA